jgi:integrase
VAAFRAKQRSARKTRVQPSQQSRKKVKPKKQPGQRYTSRTYAATLAQAIERYNKKAPADRQLPHWHPNQLRHTFATEVRRRYGLEAAQTLLGHQKADITQVYAERDLTLAVRVAAEIG